MSKEKEVKGKFRYDQDSKRFHRFKIETDAGTVVDDDDFTMQIIRMVKK